VHTSPSKIKASKVGMIQFKQCIQTEIKQKKTDHMSQRVQVSLKQITVNRKKIDERPTKPLGISSTSKEILLKYKASQLHRSEQKKNCNETML